MAGEARTNRFMLSTATVMLGAPEDLNELQPSTHSIGLVKNVNVTAETAFTELMQGVQSSLVHSTKTGNTTRVSAEVYEYTAKNLGYALGLSGTTLSTQTVQGSIAIAVDALDTSIDLVLGEGSLFVAGDTIIIRTGSDDVVVVRKVTAVATDTLTLNLAVPAAIPVGSVVRKSNVLALGDKGDQPFLSCQIAGKLVNGDPAVFMFPKIRITGGFNFSFATDNYGNMPFEFAVYDLTSVDPFYAEYAGAPGKLVTV
jgi:hypothetical protein